MAKTMPLLLLPGLLCDAALWRHQTATLGDVAEVRVPDLTRQDSIGSMAEAVLADAPPAFALAGLSMGGYVAMEIMRRAASRVLRLALIDTTHRADPPEQTRKRRLLIRQSMFGEFRGVTGRLLPLLVHEPNIERGDIAKTVFAMAERVGREAFQRQQTAIMGRPDSTPDLSGFSCRTLVLCGRHDRIAPLAVHQDMAARLPNAALVVIEDSGHLSPLEQPQAVSACLRCWLVS